MIGRLTGKRLAIWLGILFVLAMAACWFSLPDPDLVQAELLRQQLAGHDSRSLSIPVQHQLRQQFHEQLQHLAPQQQWKLWNTHRQQFLDRIDRVLAMPPGEQIPIIDAEIDRLEALRQEAARTARADGTPRKSLDERERLFKQQLDQTTPGERSKLARYFKLVGDRRRDRGLPPGHYPDGL